MRVGTDRDLRRESVQPRARKEPLDARGAPRNMRLERNDQRGSISEMRFDADPRARRGEDFDLRAYGDSRAEILENRTDERAREDACYWELGMQNVALCAIANANASDTEEISVAYRSG